MNELEFVFNKIIEIDNKAIEVKEKTNQLIKDKESSLTNDMKELEDKLSTELSVELKMMNEKIISDANENAKKIMDESKQFCENLIKKYELIKGELIDKIVNEIIES
ncbi:hypothetical protein GC105_02245 [Alkalibaculum sp. M08DMB]|uniref:Uncharacterized protein n=1 Tax=Alkalibaculum sporogenes TaxID=2655001 RepID=A0A6A7K634_9FIRM|nr:hypothetical protein [Alkalibaculum sporogenes]MPW24613.1 hypothetical protein [Alkalibaculum sporogenes]